MVRCLVGEKCNFQLKKQTMKTRLTLLAVFLVHMTINDSLSQKIQSTTTEIYVNSSWVNSARNSYTYDAKGNLVNLALLTWDAGMDSWKPGTLFNYTNNSEGTINNVKVQTWDLDSRSWKNSTLTSYIYNSDDQILAATGQTFADNSWLNSSQNNYTYDTKGNLTNLLLQIWDSEISNWKNSGQYNYTNNSYGVINESVHQIWDTNLNSWKNSIMISFSYNSSNQIRTIINKKYQNDNCLNSSRSIHTYDSKGYLSEILFEAWNEGLNTWTSSSRNQYINSSNGTVDNLVVQYWNTNSNSWENSSRTTYIYEAVLDEKMISIEGDLSFGKITVGQKSTKTFTISNSGNSHLSVSSINLPTDFSVDQTSFTLSPGESRQITITFSPRTEQGYSGIITVTSDATSGSNTIATNGLGVVATSKVISITGDLSFGEVTVGQTSTKTLIIRNLGNSELSVSNISLPADFSADQMSFTVSSGQNQHVKITFSPQTNQVYSGIITLTSDATSGSNTIATNGLGVVATSRVISITGDLSFGEVTVGQTSTKTLTISNSGNSELSVSDISLPADFSADQMSFIVSSGQNQHVKIAFSPQTNQVYSDIITLTSDATSGPNTIMINGEGVLDDKILKTNHDAKNEPICFPNPTKGGMVVKPEFQFYQISVLDIHGKMVFMEKNSSEFEEKMNIDLNTLDRGVYFLIVMADDKSSTVKIRIE